MRRRPLLTNTATGAVVMLVGDGLAQKHEMEGDPHNTGTACFGHKVKLEAE